METYMSVKDYIAATGMKRSIVKKLLNCYLADEFSFQNGHGKTSPYYIRVEKTGKDDRPGRLEGGVGIVRDGRMPITQKILVVILFVALVGCVISQAIQRENSTVTIWTEDG